MQIRDYHMLLYHLRSSRNHVFDKVGMTRTVCMSIMSVLSGIFNMSDVDCNASRLFFWCFVNCIIRHVLGQPILLQDFGDGLFDIYNLLNEVKISAFIKYENNQIKIPHRSQCCLPMIDVTDGANVGMG